nr:hypothetical protein Iba_chr01cCG2900 [Ipomoea batatas]
MANNFKSQLHLLPQFKNRVEESFGILVLSGLASSFGIPTRTWYSSEYHRKHFYDEWCWVNSGLVVPLDLIIVISLLIESPLGHDPGVVGGIVLLGKVAILVVVLPLGFWELQSFEDGSERRRADAAVSSSTIHPASLPGVLHRERAQGGSRRCFTAAALFTPVAGRRVPLFLHAALHHREEKVVVAAAAAGMGMTHGRGSAANALRSCLAEDEPPPPLPATFHRRNGEEMMFCSMTLINRRRFLQAPGAAVHAGTEK